MGTSERTDSAALSRGVHLRSAVIRIKCRCERDFRFFIRRVPPQYDNGPTTPDLRRDDGPMLLPLADERVQTRRQSRHQAHDGECRFFTTSLQYDRVKSHWTKRAATTK